MATTNSYPKGENFAQHVGGENCPCKPSVRTTIKAFASVASGVHQGYKQGDKVVTHRSLK